MPSIRLRLPRNWYEEVQRAAEEQRQTPEQFVLDLLSTAIPPPKVGPGRWTTGQHQALLDRVQTLCRLLDATRGGLVAALRESTPDPRYRPDVAAKRQRSADALRTAMQAKGVTHAQLAEHIGVARSTVTKMATGSASLPPAWLDSLDQLFGEGWLKPM